MARICRVPRPMVPDDDLLRANVDFDPHRYRDINQIIDVWIPLTLAMNCINRSMGRAETVRRNAACAPEDCGLAPCDANASDSRTAADPRPGICPTGRPR